MLYGKRIAISLLASFLELFAVVSGFAQAPPKVFIDRGACPFEGCTYRRWTVTSDTALYGQPEGTKPVGEVHKGETVDAIDGEVHVVPTPMTVVFNHEDFHRGDRVYLLTYLGEGFMEVWFEGKISVEEVLFLFTGDDLWPTCLQASADCWGRIEKREPFDWWILIKPHQGKSGWTKESDHFGEKDLYE